VISVNKNIIAFTFNTAKNEFVTFGHRLHRIARIDGVFEESYYPACMTELTLTAIFEEAEEGGYIGYVAELPGANTQGETLEETRENLTEAIQLILNSNREQFEKKLFQQSKM
jgi:predicted RNase H-like HicB family nuclease